MSERIVVGVDGSEGATSAVRWAAREARLRGAELELVTAWQLPTYSGAFAMASIPDELVDELAAEAKRRVAEAAEEARGEGCDADIETRVVEGPPATGALGCRQGRRPSGGRLARARRIQRTPAGIREPPVRPSRILPCSDRARSRSGERNVSPGKS